MKKQVMNFLSIALMAKVLKDKYGVKEVIIGYVGAVIGSHAGPGVLTLFFMGDHR